MVLKKLLEGNPFNSRQHRPLFTTGCIIFSATVGGGGDGCKFAIGLTRAVYLGLARLHEALPMWNGRGRRKDNRSS